MPRPTAPLRAGYGSDTRPGQSGLTFSGKQLGAVPRRGGLGTSFPALQAGRSLGLASPSTAAAARLRERRGGPGGPAGLLLGPARPSYTSCKWGALKGFARARCATDENIFLGKEGPVVR